MEIKNLFDKDTYEGLVERVNTLSSSTERKWGKMNVAQMLAHCKAAFRVPLSEKRLPRMFLGRVLGWAVKHKLYDDSIWKQGLPTAPDFIVKDERDFDTEKTALLALIRRFHEAGPGGAGLHPHPLFGTFTSEQWGKAMWKHMDHHLRQFGV